MINEPKQEQFVDKILDSKLTRLVALIGAVYAVVTNIIIPLNTLKIQQDQIYSQLVTLTTNITNQQATITSIQTQATINTQAIKDLANRVTNLENKATK